MKRFTICIAAVCLLLTLFAPAAFAAETEGEDGADNRCGENLSWTLDGSTLTISGIGNMDDFPDGAPWADSRESIHTVILSGGVTSVGAGAFTGYQNLTAVDFGSSLKEIGEKAFQSCEGLTKISLPASFRRFGPSCFEGCTNLTEVYCDGGMPSFNANCLWNGGTITIYCPVNNVWPEQYVEELETNFHGRLQVLTADGSDPFRFDTETMNPPHHVDGNSDFVKTLLNCYEMYTGRKGECVAIGGGTYVHHLENGVAFGASMPDTENHMHGPDEFAVVEELLTSAKIFAQAIVELCC